MLLFGGAASHIRAMPIPFCVRIDGRGDHCVHDPRDLQRVGRSVGDQPPVLCLSGIEPDLMSLPKIRCRPISPPIREGNGAKDGAPVRREMAGLDCHLALVRRKLVESLITKSVTNKAPGPGMDQLTLLLVGVLVALAIVGVVWLHFWR